MFGKAELIEDEALAASTAREGGPCLPVHYAGSLRGSALCTTLDQTTSNPETFTQRPAALCGPRGFAPLYGTHLRTYVSCSIDWLTAPPVLPVRQRLSTYRLAVFWLLLHVAHCTFWGSQPRHTDRGHLQMSHRCRLVTCSTPVEQPMSVHSRVRQFLHLLVIG